MSTTSSDVVASQPNRPAKTSVLTAIKRAFGWNLGKVVPSQAEVETLAAAGLTDPAMQKYAAWRRSALSVAAVWTAGAFVLGVLDTIEEGIKDLTAVGVTLHMAWLAVSALMAVACVIGALRWTRPGSGSKLLIGAWAAGFLLPFIYALLPVSIVYHVKSVPVPEGDMLAKARAMGELAVDFVMSAGGYLLLLPAVLSLIPGTVNGCLRIKSLLPAAQLPGWLLVCAAPLFVLFWVIVLVIVNHAANNWALVLGVLLWAGAPIWYSLRGEVFVQSQIGEAEAARIGGVKRLVGITTMLGLALLGTFALTAKVAEFKVLGFDHEHAMSTKIDELSELDGEVSLEDVTEAFNDSNSLLYALDLSSWQFVVDFLAKVLVVTVVFADLVLFATVTAWKNDRRFRAEAGAGEYDATMAQAGGGAAAGASV